MDGVGGSVEALDISTPSQKTRIPGLSQAETEVFYFFEWSFLEQLQKQPPVTKILGRCRRKLCIGRHLKTSHTNKRAISVLISILALAIQSNLAKNWVVFIKNRFVLNKEKSQPPQHLETVFAMAPTIKW